MWRGLRYGGALGLAYVANVQILTWMGLGLTSWVLGLDLALMVAAVVALHWRLHARHGLVPGGVATLLSVALVVFAAGLIRQAYMVIYLVFIDPSWVDMVVQVRRDLLAAAGVPAEEISQRLLAVRSGFTPARMFTTGVLIPGLWKFGIAVVLTVAVRVRLAGAESVRGLRALAAVLPTLLRILLGVMFIYSGWSWLNRPNPAAYLADAINPSLEAGRMFGFYEAFLRTLVVPNFDLFAALVGFGELMVGISIGFGAATRLGAAGVAFLFLNYGLLGGTGSLISHAIQLAVVLIPVAFNSGRRFGVDRWLYERWPGARIW